MMFEIKIFYPSISKELLTDALTFAESLYENGTYFQMESSKQVHKIVSWFQEMKMTSFLKKSLYCKFKVTVD